MKKAIVLAISSALFLSACASTDTYTNHSTNAQNTVPLQLVSNTQNEVGQGQLTMEQIMAHPDWMGNNPERPYWALDGKSILFYQKQTDSPVYDLKQIHLGQTGEAEQVAYGALHEVSSFNPIYQTGSQLAAYIYENNIFLFDQATGKIRQLTQDAKQKSQLKFLNSGQLSYREGNDFYQINPNTGQIKLIAALALADKKTTANQAPADYLAKEEVDLIQFVQVQRKEKEQQFEQQAALRANPSLAPAPFYLGKNQQIVAAELSPNADKLVVAVTEPQSWRGEKDLMPRFVTESGRIEMQPVRRRVADATPVSHKLYLLDIKTGEQTELAYNTLPGFDEDVLKSVREENYQAEGKTYKSKKTPRAIGLMSAWAARAGNIIWQDNGDEVALVLRAWDNKDRWIATVDFKSKKLVSQHRLHDSAWVGNDFNEVGWLPNSHTLWYNSEESGYAHLYTLNLAQKNAKAKQITSGKYLVNKVVLDKAGQNFYIQANKTHPGIYEVYKVPTQGGELEQLTYLEGMTDFSLSPDESQLLLSHSNALQPTELYVQANQAGAEPTRMTQTQSEAFASISWQAPEIVPVPSKHVEDPIYTRVYYPKGYDANSDKTYPAVIFTHGAGYLQNAHAGWSNYFREFMFHNLLLEKGYVVMDLDYRGSAGYGRDWRTAIYRQMGTPEVEDLVDVVDWATQNASVDKNRVGTYGGSYGGFLTFMSLLTEPGLFKAGAALRPVSDWAHYNTGYTSNILNLPQDDPIAYRRSSPIYYAEGLQDALLINAPMVDDNVFFQDSVRIVQRFIELEKDNFETAIFPVEPHGFIQPSSWLNEYRKILKLFEENLK